MRCKTCLRRLDSYLDEELSDSGRTELEAHVAGCPACAAELSHARELFSLVEESRVDDWADPDQAWSEFRSRAARGDVAPEPRRRLLEILIPVAVTGAFAAVALTLAVGERNPEVPDRAEPPAVAAATDGEEPPAQELVEVLTELDLYENLDCFEEVKLVAHADPEQDAALLEALLKEVEG